MTIICFDCTQGDYEGLFIGNLEKRVSLGDSRAMFNLGVEYEKGRCIKADMKKAIELYQQAAENGSVSAHNTLAQMYRKGGNGLEVNSEKAIHHEIAAAMGGHNISRHNIGAREIQAWHVDRGFKHLVIAASDGHQPSLTAVKKGYMAGCVKKEDYANALRAYQESIDAVKSKQREDGLKMLTMIRDTKGLAEYLRQNAAQRKQQQTSLGYRKGE